MLSVLAFFIYGTGVIKDFMLALVVGIVAARTRVSMWRRR
jgi:preprotein translocase subunit SecF